MTVFEKITLYKAGKNYCKFKRDVGNQSYELSHGYILDYSDNFLLIIENDDFKFNGYNIFPISSIVKIRHNKFDQHFDFLMEAEGQKEFIKNSFEIDLQSWQTIFKSIKNYGLNCGVENESYHNFFFKIGEIVKSKRKSLLILNFDPIGYIDKEFTKVKYKLITKVIFDDNYTNVMSKYLKKRI